MSFIVRNSVNLFFRVRGIDDSDLKTVYHKKIYSGLSFCVERSFDSFTRYGWQYLLCIYKNPVQKIYGQDFIGWSSVLLFEHETENEYDAQDDESGVEGCVFSGADFYSYITEYPECNSISY